MLEQAVHVVKIAACCMADYASLRTVETVDLEALLFPQFLVSHHD